MPPDLYVKVTAHAAQEGSKKIIGPKGFLGGFPEAHSESIPRVNCYNGKC